MSQPPTNLLRYRGHCVDSAFTKTYRKGTL